MFVRCRTRQWAAGTKVKQVIHVVGGRALMRIRLRRPEGLRWTERSEASFAVAASILYLIFDSMFAVDDCVFKYHFIFYV